MTISDEGIALLKQYEGSVKNGDIHIIYDDKTGRPVNPNLPLPRGATIGYGHLIQDGEDFTEGITEFDANKLLRNDVAFAEQAVQNNISAKLTQNQYDALVIFAYNIGTRNFANSTVVKYINNPDFHNDKHPTLESAWRAWNKSGGHEITGLTNRRNQEWNLFNN